MPFNLFPYLFRNLLHKRQLRPLLFFHELIANLA